MISWPTQQGYEVGAQPERSVWMSLPQMPQCVMRISMSVSDQVLGVKGAWTMAPCTEEAERPSQPLKVSRGGGVVVVGVDMVGRFGGLEGKEARSCDCSGEC